MTCEYQCIYLYLSILICIYIYTSYNHILYISFIHQHFVEYNYTYVDKFVDILFIFINICCMCFLCFTLGVKSFAWLNPKHQDSACHVYRIFILRVVESLCGAAGFVGSGLYHDML